MEQKPKRKYIKKKYKLVKPTAAQMKPKPTDMYESKENVGKGCP